jgi:anti-anti-sigma factor
VQLIAVSDRPSSPHTMGRLTMTTSGRSDQRTISLRGELDVASAPILEETIEEMCEEGCKEIIIDLAGVEFIDSSGLNSILRAKATCEEHGCEYALNPAQRPAQRVFEMTRVVDKLRFRPSTAKGAER